MITALYREHEYYHIWNQGDTIGVNRGTIGQKGVVTRNPIQPTGSVQAALRQEVEKAVQDGFVALSDEQLDWIMIGYRFTVSWEGNQVLTFEAALKDLLQNELGWTGNGLYDGYALGQGSLTVWCRVVKVNSALNSIIAILNSHGYLEDEEVQVTVAFEENGAYTVSYPPERKGERVMS